MIAPREEVFAHALQYKSNVIADFHRLSQIQLICCSRQTGAKVDDDPDKQMLWALPWPSLGLIHVPKGWLISHGFLSWMP